MGRILLTGAAGFIGSHVAASLLRRGESVLGLDNLNDFYDPAIKRRNVAALESATGFQFVSGDIRDRECVAAALSGAGVDRVAHLAAMAGVRPSLADPALYADVNVRGTAILFSEAERAGIERFVFASSSSVYGERSDPPFCEADQVDRPISPYAATKKAGELLCHSLHAKSGIPVTCLRYFTVYGPRQRPEMAISRFARRIAAGRPVPLFGDGASARDYTYVDDIVAGTLAALDRADGYHIYNLGGARATTLIDLVRILSETIGREARIEHLPAQTGDVSLTFASVDRAEKELGYRPTVRIEEGIRRFVEWQRGGPA